MSLFVEAAGKTDVGCVRQNNEDNFGYDSRHGIYVVCDGMGGQAAGEVASKIAVDTVLAYFRDAKHNGNLPQLGAPLDNLSARANALASAIQLANTNIHQAAAQDAAHSGMGSTIAAVLVEDNSFSVGHAGDSRIYRLRDGILQQLTRDHSLVMEQVRRGILTQEEAQHSDMQNIIIRALGPEPTVEPDAILHIVQDATSLPLMAGRLVDAARDAGGSDNITALLLRFHQQPWYKKLLSRGASESHDSI
jgi:protein phosphatase